MSDPAALVAARLADLWRKSLPVMQERITVLRAACSALSRNAADAEARGAGREAAHKLSGSLGVFGLPRGSELAAEMETILKGDEPLTPEAIAALNARAGELEAAIASKG